MISTSLSPVSMQGVIFRIILGNNNHERNYSVGFEEFQNGSTWFWFSRSSWVLSFMYLKMVLLLLLLLPSNMCIILAYFFSSWFFFFNWCSISIERLIHFLEGLVFNPLSVNPTKWSNTLKQFFGNIPTNCLSVLDYFVGLALKGLIARLSYLFSYKQIS